jgi:predicted alpha/beta superfamily hydrolase
LASELIVHSDFRSEVLNCQRTIVVYLPPGYRRDTRRQYPLFLLHDGQNVFDGSTSYVPGQYWRVRESADWLLTHRRIEPVIICAVYHGHERRIFEYTPTKTRKMGGGGVDLHGRMIVDELRPWLRERYRISPQSRHTGVGGSSLGGLATLLLGLTYPEVFGRLAVMSPSVWWDHRTVLKMVEVLHTPRRQRVWLDIGTNEGASAFHSLRDVRLLKAMLVSKGWREPHTLRYAEFDGADHSEGAWASRVPAMLEYLYPRKK